MTFYTARERSDTPVGWGVYRSDTSVLRCTYGGGGDVRQVGRDTGGVDDIVEGELVDEGAELQQQREGLE